jgi:DNA-directed RNA polymerase specialized sigma24 family protein
MKHLNTRDFQRGIAKNGWVKVTSVRRMPPAGRPPGRRLTDLELQHLRFLLEVREKATAATHLYTERLEDAVLECREGGASSPGMAEQLGVSATTIRSWTKNAKRRREPSA